MSLQGFDEALIEKIKTLNETVWEKKVTSSHLERWLSNFSLRKSVAKRDKDHALHLISQFMYFGSRQIRELLRALYRDLYKYPIVAKIRATNHNTTDEVFINTRFKAIQESTRFM